jgi:hypothetical protein
MAGFVLPALAIGLGSISVKPQRAFIPQSGNNMIVPHVTLEEVHSDELEITDHPVEQGSSISDHAFKRYAEVITHCAFSDSFVRGSSLVSQATGLGAALGGSKARALLGTAATAQSLLMGFGNGQIKAIYDDIIALQTNRILCDLYTGKRKYKNMLPKSIRVTTSKEWENALMIVIHWREILIAKTSVVRVPASAQANPSVTADPVAAGEKKLQTVKKTINPELYGG